MTFLGELRPYQAVASSLITNRGKALLALDLGTGKTIVSLHAIEKLRDEGKVKCALLIMSSSLTKQWEQRINQFTDSTARLVDGSIAPKKRSTILSECMEDPPDYLIIGIRQAISEFRSLQLIKPDLVLVDEVTSIKNFGSQQSKTIKKFQSTYRIGLTAEPIENGKAEELFSIMQWIDPTVLGDWRKFDSEFITRNTYTNFPTGYKNMDKLNEVLMTACVNKRRDDPDVAEFMPTVEEFNVYVEMDDECTDLYNEITRELLHNLYRLGPGGSRDLTAFYEGGKSEDNSELGPVTSRLLAAHLLLDSPYILRNSGLAYADDSNKQGSKYASQLLDAGRIPSSIGAKMEACIELCQEYLEEDPEHKVIVFARFKGVLPLLQQHLDKYGSVVFTGDLNSKQRGEAIERFTNEPDTRLFLSSDAGGYGVDLWVGSHLINYDLPNAAGTFKQRNGRHVRASSKFRKVYVDNLIIRGSIEEYQLSRLDYKNRVAKAALTGQMSDPAGTVTNEGKNLTKFLENYLEKV